MAVNLSPIGNGVSFLGTTGLPLASGQLFTYQAGSSTPITTYQDPNGLIANTNPIILGTDGRLPAELWLTYGYNYKFVLEDSNSNIIATYDNIYGILGTIPATAPSLPSGCIILWSGAIGSIPSGYYLCNGQNGTPDLRDRFIIGAGNSYSVGQTGGSADSIVVAHTHIATSSVTDPGHYHMTDGTLGSSKTVVYAGRDAPFDYHSSYGSPNDADYISGSQTGIITTGVSVSTTNTTTGTSGTGANIPPYYALCYIMKA